MKVFSQILTSLSLCLRLYLDVRKNKIDVEVAWNIKRNLFGLDFDIDISGKFPTLFTSYSKKLRKLWYGSFLIGKISAHEVIVRSLRLLPKGFYIIYSFSLDDKHFVQFLHDNGIALDFPLYFGYPQYRKRTELIKILNKYKIFYYDLRVDKKHSEIRANFKYDYETAATICLEIVKKIYKITHFRNFHIADTQELRKVV